MLDFSNLIKHFVSKIMRSFALLVLFVFALNIMLTAQNTKKVTMRVSATVISGASITGSQPINITDSENHISKDSVFLKQPDHIEITFEIDPHVELKNRFGDRINYSSSFTQVPINQGFLYEVILKSSARKKKKESLTQNTYLGELIASVHYF